METTYKLIGTKLYVVQTQEAEVIDFADISEATLIYIQPELLDSYKVLNPDYSALMKPYSYTVISSKAPAWKDEPGPGPEPPTPVERFKAHIIPAHEFGMGEDDQRHIAFWNKTRNIGHGEVYNNKSDGSYYLQDYGTDPDYDIMPTWHVARGDRMFAALDDAGDHPSQAKVIHVWYDRDNTRGTVESETIQRQNGYWFQTMEFENGEDGRPGVFFTIPEEFAEEDFIFIINENALITQTIQNWPEGCQNNVMIDQLYGSNEHKYYWIPEGVRWSHDNRAWPEEYKSLELSFYPAGEYHTTGGWLGGPIIVQPRSGFTVTVTEPSFEEQYLTFTVKSPGTITIEATDSGETDSNCSVQIEYSKDGGTTWNMMQTDIYAQSFGNFNTGDKLMVKGVNDMYGDSDAGSWNHFGGTAEVDVSGNIMSMIYGDDFEGKTSFPDGSSYNFFSLFGEYTNLINASNLILPVTTMTDNCYNGMFTGCTSLTQAPELPATTLADYCYGSMFDGCTALTTAPELPVTTMTDNCYDSMFSSCMSLTTAPELPATTLANNCYNAMFYGCTGLTQAPELPATTLAEGCYSIMFNGCTKLNYIKAMFTTTPSDDFTSNWVSGVSSTGTFVKNSAATWDVTGTSGIPEGWTVETASA